MIQKIFPTINNIVPYKSKVSTVYAAIQYTDTPLSVKSHGPDVSWYTTSTVNIDGSPTYDNLVWRSNVPSVKFYSGYSWPPEVSTEFFNNAHYITNFNGYYKAESTSATIFLTGYGKAFVNFNGNVLSTIELGVHNTAVATIGATGLTPGSYYSLNIRYLSPSKFDKKENILCVKHKTNSMFKEELLAAGNYLSINDVDVGVTNYSLPYITNVKINQTNNRNNKVTFEVPLVSDLSTLGYKYIQNGDYLESVADSTKKIKKLRMIELYVGYDYDGSLATITKFVGQIRGFIPKRGNQEIVIVECSDWTSFVNDRVDEGSPSLLDYLVAGYIAPRFSRANNETSFFSSPVSIVDGKNKPRCYDGWLAQYAMESILLQADIDPSLLRQKREVLGVDDVETTGRFLMHGLNEQSPLSLAQNNKYGNPFSVGGDSDDAYNYQFSVGDKLTNNLQEISDQYGFQYGFNNKGNFYVNAIKSPVQYKSIDDMTFTGSWATVTNSRMLFSVSNVSDVVTDSVVATFVGAGGQLVFNVSSPSATFHVRVTNPTLTGQYVATFNYNTSYDSTRYFLDGEDDAIGYNPCVLNIATGLRYGTYSINLSVVAGTVFFNSLIVNEKDYTTNQDILRTDEVITDLTTKSTADNLRNDVIVIGKQTGLNVNMSIEDPSERVVNPNNPTSTHVTARAIDRASIGSISASNYAGRRLQTLIIDPKFTNQDRVNWLALETAKRFNTFKKNVVPNISAVGQPLLELGDKVQAVDVGKNIVGTIHTFWVSDTFEEYGKDGKYLSRVNLEAFEPWQSYTELPVPSTTHADFISNISIYNSGLNLKPFEGDWPQIHPHQSDLSDPPATILVKCLYPNETGVTSTLLDTLIGNAVPKAGYIKQNAEVVRYLDASVGPFSRDQFQRLTATIQYTQVTRGMFNTSTIALTNGSYVSAHVSPYGTEEHGIFPAIAFDLNFPGEVQILIYDSSNTLVDILTGNPDVISELEGWEKLQPGQYIYNWGILDRSGDHNQVNTGMFFLSGGTDDIARENPAGLGDWLPYLGSGIIPGGSYTVGSDFYVQNDRARNDASFRVVISYRDPTKKLSQTVSQFAPPREIHTALRQTGPGAWYPGTHEEFRLDRSVTVLSDQNTVIPLLTDDPAGISNKGYQNVFSGDENDGNGIKITYSNDQDIERIVNVEVERSVVILVNYQQGQTYTTEGFHFSDTDAAGSFTQKIGADPSKYFFYLPAPPTGFLPGEVGTFVNNIAGEPSTRWLRVSNINMVTVTTTDMSGRRDRMSFSLYYVPSSFYTKDGGQSYPPTGNLIIPRTFNMGPGDEGTWFILPSQYDNTGDFPNLPINQQRIGDNIGKVYINLRAIVGMQLYWRLEVG